MNLKSDNFWGNIFLIFLKIINWVIGNRYNFIKCQISVKIMVSTYIRTDFDRYFLLRKKRYIMAFFMSECFKQEIK